MQTILSVLMIFLFEFRNEVLYENKLMKYENPELNFAKYLEYLRKSGLLKVTALHYIIDRGEIIYNLKFDLGQHSNNTSFF